MFDDPRVSAFPIESLILKRWSPRSFDRSTVSDFDLGTIFEAARWAPSAFNHQPWRFLYARRDSEHWERFVGLLMPFNAAWAKNASVLTFVLSDTLIQMPMANSLSQSHSHSFDAGAACAFMILQAARLGYHTHGMSGIDIDRVRTELAVPERFRVEMALALGRRGSIENLPPPLQAREKPSGRHDMKTLAAEGAFSWAS